VRHTTSCGRQHGHGHDAHDRWARGHVHVDHGHRPRHVPGIGDVAGISGRTRCASPRPRRPSR
jgi:hypothetical protein